MLESHSSQKVIVKIVTMNESCDINDKEAGKK